MEVDGVRKMRATILGKAFQKRSIQGHPNKGALIIPIQRPAVRGRSLKFPFVRAVKLSQVIHL